MNTWWSLGRLGGVPIRLHWSALLGAVFFSGLRFAPGAWLGFVLVILVHELGHAFVVKVTKQHVLRVDVHGLGGECHWAGDATPIQRAAIAWGGVWGQLALAIVAAILSLFVGRALGAFGADLFYALTWGSLLIAGLNLLPFAPLDGAEAWKLPPLLVKRWRQRKARRSASSKTASSKAASSKTAPAYSAQARVVDPADGQGSRRAQPAAGGTKAKSDEALRQLLLGVARDARDARKPRQ